MIALSRLIPTSIGFGSIFSIILPEQCPYPLLDDEKVTTVRYEAVNAILLNEFVNEHRQVSNTRLTSPKEVYRLNQEELIAKQQRQIEALTGGLRR